MNYQTLKAGDVRKAGDEVAEYTRIGSIGFCPNTNPTLFETGDWNRVNLIGYSILTSDLIAARFRRPLP